MTETQWTCIATGACLVATAALMLAIFVLNHSA